MSQQPKTSEPEAEVQPYIAPGTVMHECTARALILGTLLGVVFGASSLYLVLKVGMTVSASIPVAVISLTLFRLWSKTGGRDATILENNIAQTAGSAGESIAFGLGATMPAIMILGFDLEITRVMLVAILGGLLGIVMMIPLRRALIVKQHAELKYPEGTACAEVLKAGANAESHALASAAAQAEAKAMSLARGRRGPNAVTIFSGLGIGLLYRTAMSAFKLWKDTPEKVFGKPFAGGSVSMEISPELLGVGYIIGPRISLIMAGGGVLAYLVLIPLIKFFGDGLTTVLPPGTKLIRDMAPGDIRQAYILYVGAGAVAAGGIISLVRSLPVIWHGIRAGLADFSFGRRISKNATKAGDPLAPARIPRTDQDLSMRFVVGGCLALIGAILVAPGLEMNLLGALLILLFGFLFVTVSSRLTGEIGSSSNPISGMTVATLLLTCLIFLLAGKTGGGAYVTALSVGGIVCVAASNGGTTSQDLKTGFLLGATPRYQQIAILIGATASALALGPILLLLNNTAVVYVPAAEAAPGLHAPAGAKLEVVEKLAGPQGQQDTKSYHVWQKTDAAGGPAGKYLVDDTGAAVYLVDPGINGSYKKRPDGTEVHKFDAPKAVLMSYIIKGILDRQLPWGLVILGVMIAIVLEMSGISSLAFAVGVYLPLSSSTPLMVGGLVRWLVDRKMRHALKKHDLNEAQLAAESDKSPGVLLASGYIAGGAITGIVVALMATAFSRADLAVTKWSEAHNPFFDGPNSDWLALLPFAALTGFLYLVAREKVLSVRTKEPG